MRGNRVRMDQLTPIYSPRTTQKLIKQSQGNMLSNLTLNVDKYTVNRIRAEFQSRGNELSLVDFIVLVKKNMQDWQPDLPNREFKLVKSLIELYKELDGGRDSNKLQWDRFTNFIIGKVTQLKSTKIDQVRPYTKTNAHLKQKFLNSLHKVIYIPELQRIAFFQQGRDKVYLMNPQTGELNLRPLTVQPKKLTVQMSSIKKQRDGKLIIKKKNLIIPTQTIILDILYIQDPKYKVLLTSTNDGVIRGWKFQGTNYVLASQPENQQDFIVHQFVKEIYCMAWDSLNEILYCSDKEGSITTWNLKTDIEKVLEEEAKDGHTLVVMAMVTMPKLQFMASGGMDGKLILWDTINNRKKWIYKEHARGIMTLTFNQALILLFSGGFDHTICIWNPYISNVIHKIQAHSCPIYSLRVIQGTHQLLSMDSQGTIKVIDMRKFMIVNSFSVDSSDDKHRMQPQCLTILPKPLKVVICGRTINIFQYDKNYMPSNVDDSMAICCKFVPEMLSLFTPVGTKIKVWSLLTGEVDKVYNGVAKADITAFCLTMKGQSAIVGDAGGQVQIVSLKNGGKERELPRHNGEVGFLLTIKALKFQELFITAATDNQIRIIKENDAGRYQIIRTITIKKDVAISALVYSQKAKAIIVGTNFGVIGFYQIQTGKLIGSTAVSSIQTSVTSINLIQTLPFLIETNSSGRISIIAVPPHQLRYSRIFSMIQPDSESAFDTAKITCSILVKHRLYVGDDKGYLKCYNLTTIFDELATLTSEVIAASTVSPFRLSITSIGYFFSIRAHPQTIKSLDVIPSESLIISCSLDKKAKIWSSDSGASIDLLQQNFQRDQPRPLAYQKIDMADGVQVFSLNFRDKIPLKSDEPPSVLVSEFDPKWLFERMEKIPENGLSNPNWKVFPKFDENYRREMEEFAGIWEKVKRREEEFYAERNQKRASGVNFFKNAAQLSEELQLKKTPSTSTADNLRQIRDSEFKARRNFLEDIKHLILKKDTGGGDLRTRAIHQKQHSESLYRRQSIGKLYYKDDKVIRLSEEEAKAAYNLSAALTNADKRDIRALKFVNNVVLREESSKSLHHRTSSSNVRLPRI